jgi:L-aminopeptidase/D-esterase-like protein
MTLTSVEGVRVGHATCSGGGSGCTVVVGPFRAAVHVSGMATGTRDLDALSPYHLVEEIHAILLSGGSAYGLAAADGVMAWLEEQRIGFETGGSLVPIVPAAVIFDLQEGRPRPDSDVGRAACAAATSDAVLSGRVGAGIGATVGKMAGSDHASPGGVGSASVTAGEWTVAALSVVNAIGDVLAADGSMLAGGRSDGGPDGHAGPAPLENTTLSVIATDAPLSRVDLGRVARMASTGLARRISPVNTPYDGDVTFAVSPTRPVVAVDAPTVLSLGVAARDALESAIEAAVTSS